MHACIFFVLASGLRYIQRASRPPGIKVGDAAGEISLLLGVRLQLAVVQPGHSCVINAEFQPKKPQNHSACFGFLLHNRKIFWVRDVGVGDEGAGAGGVRHFLPSRAIDCRQVMPLPIIALCVCPQGIIIPFYHRKSVNQGQLEVLDGGEALQAIRDDAGQLLKAL